MPTTRPKWTMVFLSLPLLFFMGCHSHSGEAGNGESAKVEAPTSLVVEEESAPAGSSFASQPAPAEAKDESKEEVAPSPPSAEPFRIVLFSDLNERYGDTHYRDTVHDAVSAIAALDPDLVMIAGDMVAGQKKNLDYQAMWEVFRQDILTPLDAPVAVTIGNHDGSAYERFEGERRIAIDLWRDQIPFLGLEPIEELEILDDELYPLRYSFRLGPAFVAVLDATHRDALRESSMEWLEGALSSTQASEAEVRLVMSHLPLFPVAIGRERDYLLKAQDQRESMMKILDDGGVDFFISGHHHAFFPATYEAHETKLLALSCVGGGARAYIGHPREIPELAPEERSIVVLDIVGGELSFRAFAGPSFDESTAVKLEGLPEDLRADEFVLKRWIPAR